MKVLLIDPPWYTLQSIKASTVSLGLTAIAGALEAKGHDVLIWNGDLYGSDNRAAEGPVHDIDMDSLEGENEHFAFKKFHLMLNKFSPDLIGITSMTAEYFSARHLAKIAKKIYPTVPIVFGGVHPSLVPQEVLADHNVDYIVMGEGEETILELVDSIISGDLERISKIKGLGYRNNDRIAINSARELIQDLDVLPIPSYKGLVDIHMHLPTDIGGVISSRGCPYLCTYCASNKLWTRKVRYRSVSNVILEIENLYRIGVRVFRINDDTFTIHRERVVEFCREIKNFKHVRWSCDTRAELLDDDLLFVMRKSGCYQINIGIESGSPGVQEQIRKRVDLNKARDVIRKARKTGIKTVAYFMTGFPGEGKGEVELTLKLAEEMKPDYPLFSTLAPYPGTIMWQNLVEAGKLSSNIDYSKFYHHSKAMNYSKLSTEEYGEVLDRIEKLCRKVATRQKFVFALRHPFIFLKDRHVIKSQRVPIGGL